MQIVYYYITGLLRVSTIPPLYYYITGLLRVSTIPPVYYYITGLLRVSTILPVYYYITGLLVTLLLLASTCRKKTEAILAHRLSLRSNLHTGDNTWHRLIPLVFCT